MELKATITKKSNMPSFLLPLWWLGLRELLHKPIAQERVILQQRHYLRFHLLHADTRQGGQFAEAGINLANLSRLLAKIDIQLVDEVARVCYHEVLEEFSQLSRLRR